MMATLEKDFKTSFIFVMVQKKLYIRILLIMDFVMHV